MLQICQKLGRICWVEMRKCSLSLLGSRIELMVISVSLFVSNSSVSAWKELLKLICPNRLFFSFQSCSPNNPPRANVRPLDISRECGMISNETEWDILFSNWLFMSFFIYSLPTQLWCRSLFAQKKSITPTTQVHEQTWIFWFVLHSKCHI